MQTVSCNLGLPPVPMDRWLSSASLAGGALGFLQFGSEVPTVMGLNSEDILVTSTDLLVLLGWSEVSVLAFLTESEFLALSQLPFCLLNEFLCFPCSTFVCAAVALPDTMPVRRDVPKKRLSPSSLW